jgi:hypothetical protein
MSGDQVRCNLCGEIVLAASSGSHDCTPTRAEFEELRRRIEALEERAEREDTYRREQSER